MRRPTSDVPIRLFFFLFFFYLALFRLKREPKQPNRFDSSQNGYRNRPIRLIWLPKQADMAAKIDRWPPIFCFMWREREREEEEEEEEEEDTKKWLEHVRKKNKGI